MPRYKFCYSKQGAARYMSHLDLVRTLGRALRRANLPVAYSEGFNPQPRLGFAAPLPVGTAGLAELGEITTTRAVPEQQILTDLNAVLPPGLKVLQVRELPPKAPALMAAVEQAHYEVQVITAGLGTINLDQALAQFLALDKIEITRLDKKKRPKVQDLRPGIIEIKLSDSNQDQQQCALTMTLKTGSAVNVRPEQVLKAFLNNIGFDDQDVFMQITRTSINTAADA